MKDNLKDEINMLRRMLKVAGFYVIDHPYEDDQIFVFLTNGYGAKVTIQYPVHILSRGLSREVGLLELTVIKKSGKEKTTCMPWAWDWEVAYDTTLGFAALNDLTARDAFEIIQDVETLENANTNISDEINKLKEMLKEAGYYPIDLPDEYGQFVVFLNDCSVSVNVQDLFYEPGRKEGLLKLIVINKEPDPTPGIFKVSDPTTKDWTWHWGIAHTTSHDYDTTNDLTAKEAFEIIQKIEKLANADEE